MSTLRGRAEQAVEAAKDQKASIVAEDVDAEVRPTVIVWRGLQQVAVVHLVGALHGGREIIPIADQIATSFRADCVAVVTETWSAVGDRDPDTGQPWAPGAMGVYVQRHGRNNGVIRESLQALLVNAAGDHVTRWAPFEVHESSFGVARVDWLEAYSLDSTAGEGASGYMVRELVRSLADAATIGAQLSQVAYDGGLDPETADAASDAAAVKVLRSTVPDVIAMLTSSPDTPIRTAYLEESLGGPMSSSVEEAFEAARKRGERA